MNRACILKIATGVVLAVSSVASAGYVLNVTPVVEDSGFSSPESALTGFNSYALTVSSTAGEVITAVHAIFDGPLHQTWTGTVTADPTPSAVLAGNTSGDSALTPITNDITVAFTENNNVSPSPLPDTFVSGSGGFDFGVGNALSGAWGVVPAFQGTSADVAYLVIPVGESVSYSITLSDTLAGSLELTGSIDAMMAFILGDMNNDGFIDNLDINPFVLALTDPAQYQIDFGLDPDEVGDINDDGVLDNLDINPFVALLTGSSPGSSPSIQSTPEPSAAVAIIGLAGCLLMRRSRSAKPSKR